MKEYDSGGAAIEETLLDKNARAAMQALIGVGAQQIRTLKANDGDDFSSPGEAYYYGWPVGEDGHKNPEYTDGALHISWDAYRIARAMIAQKRQLELAALSESQQKRQETRKDQT